MAEQPGWVSREGEEGGRRGVGGEGEMGQERVERR
jgi:hypothetical protein